MPSIWKKCTECGKRNHYRAVCRNARQSAVHELEQESDEYTEKDRQMDMVNIYFTNSNSNIPGIIAKLNTSIYQNSVKISYKADTGSNRNILPSCIYKGLFPRSTKKLLS